MDRRAPRLKWRRKREPTANGETIRLDAVALIHLGTALRAYQEGDTLRALRHLALAAESINALMERWTTREANGHAHD